MTTIRGGGEEQWQIFQNNLVKDRDKIVNGDGAATDNAVISYVSAAEVLHYLRMGKPHSLLPQFALELQQIFRKTQRCPVKELRMSAIVVL
ncbi:MAG: hypothetical protein F9K48_04725 [Candidatus Brocadia sp.]|nr:MAG: hypothetical protein F9K48_04725 [Candidatus Brocadia sp.]